MLRKSNFFFFEHRHTSYEGRDSGSFNLDQDSFGTRTASKSTATSSIVGTESLYFDQCVDVCYGTNNGVSSSRWRHTVTSWWILLCFQTRWCGESIRAVRLFFFLYFTIFPCQNETHTHTRTQIRQNGDGSVPSTRIGLPDSGTSKMEKSRSRRSILVSSRGSKTRCMPIHRVSDSRTMCKIRRRRYMDVLNGANTPRTVAVLWFSDIA